METKTENRSGLTRRKSTTKCEKLCAKEERNASLKKVSVILQKSEEERTVEEQQVLNECSEIAADLKLRWQRRDEAKRRLEEWEEPIEVLQEKSLALARAISQSEHLVIYTGAGISTAARIPDYRGTNGIWTRLQQGKDIGNHDLSLAEPTYTHMALAELHSRKVLKYIVSQNCDGLHLRSGLPRTALSELHGNMYIEVCKNCKPAREYWRLFDVTENTARYFHKTMRRCYACGQELVDTIVHFGERGTLQWPLNWKGACNNADKADTIICLGSSLKVLKRYPWLWQMNKPAKKRPNLYIVNLQWTPKDESAILKINGKCDVVMKMVMKYLNLDVRQYDREKDPIFVHATSLLESEMHTTTQPFLKENDDNSESKNVLNAVKNERENSSERKSEISESETKVKEEKSDETVKDKSALNLEITTVKEEKVEVDLKMHATTQPFLKERCESVDNKNALNFVKTEPESDDAEVKLEVDVNMTPDKNASSEDIFKVKNEDQKTSVENRQHFEEQSEALDFSKQHKSSLDNRNDCDINTHTNIKLSYSSNNPTSSGNITVTKRKIHDRLDNICPPSKTSNTFSIDNILNNKDTSLPEQKLQVSEQTKAVNNIGNFQTLMAYYELANTVLQNQMLGYVASSMYPFQTSFLYPGLHSIINPTPIISNNFVSAQPANFLLGAQNGSASVVKKEPSPPKEPPCSFCNKLFGSPVCLYYVSAEPKFIKELYRFSKTKNCNTLLVCVCCDYTTDEEDESDCESKNKKKIVVKSENDENDHNTTDITDETSGEGVENIEECSENSKKTDSKTSKIQAGWFGKGYRKNRRTKKR